MAEVFDFGLQQHKIKMDGKFFENNLFAVAGDTGRRLEVQLLNSDNMVQNTTGISLRLNANVSGKATYAEATLVDATKGLYELDLPNGMLIAPGNWQFQWQIIGSGGEKLHSFAFMGSIGSNLSEGATEGLNFYLNLDDLKQMQEDFISGAFDSAVLETNITGKLTELETTYAPKLNEISDELLRKASKTALEAVASGAPKDVYPTLSDLNTAYPNGDSNIYVVRDNGNWYYWTGSVWEAGGVYQSSYVSKGIDMKNIITNGNFVSTNSWTPFNGTQTVSNEELVFTINALLASTRLRQVGTNAIINHMYYVRGDILPKYNTTTYLSFGGTFGNTSINPTSNVWNTVSGILTAINTSDFNLYHNTAEQYSVGDAVKFRKILVVDLTATYGVGNEPTKEDFEDLLSGFDESWFDGNTYIIPPMSIDELIREVNTKASKEELEKAIQSINKKILTVKIAGGDYNNLRDALESITDASVNNQYEVQIEEGTYDLMTLYTESEINETSFKGLAVPNYVSLVAIGRKEDTVIRMEIPETYPVETIARVAPIANMGAGGLMNITVIGRNCRYTVHDDYGYPNTKKHIKNCTFIKLAGLGNSQAWGEGSFSGMEFYFEDCEFITEYQQASYSTHNNLDFSKPSYHSFKNCKFLNKGGYFGIRFISLASGVIDKIDMEGCSVDGIIKFEEYETGVGCLFDLHMHSSSEVPILIDSTDGSQPVYSVIEQTKRMRNAESTTITKGTPVMYNNDGSVILRLGSNDVSLMLGVAMEDITNLEVGMIKTSGYLPVSDTGLTLSKGDKVGVVAGELAKVTTGDYIGVVNRNGFVKLKL